MKTTKTIPPLPTVLLIFVATCLLWVAPAWSQQSVTGVGQFGLALERVDGGKAQSTTTDENGAFDFGTLEPGDYRLRLVPQAAGRAVSHNTTRSNVRGINNPDGTEEQIIEIEINPRETRPGPDPGFAFTVGPQAARVSGTIVIAESGPASRPAMRQLQPRRSADKDP